MRVLFVCSGNSSTFEVAPFIKAQGDSLQAAGIEIDYFSIKNKGLTGYLKAIRSLRKYLKDKQYDILHAHFSLSGWVAVLGGRNIPVVLSLMGTDAQGDFIGKNKTSLRSKFFKFSTLLIQPFVDFIITKSPNLERYVYLKNKSEIIPNGINTTIFKYQKRITKMDLGLDMNKRYILFLGSPSREVKNFPLAVRAVAHLNIPNAELINPYPLPHHDIPKMLSIADVLLVTSFMEGSPNVVKEAMACNCPIVATDVGDVKWVMGDTQGCYIGSFETEDFADKIELALDFARKNGRTNGEVRIRELGLEATLVAQKIIKIYNTLLKGAYVIPPEVLSTYGKSFHHR